MPNEQNRLSDRIHIEELEISTRIEVPKKESATPQRLTVSISFWPYYEQRDTADKIDNTVNYSIAATLPRFPFLHRAADRARSGRSCYARCEV